MWREENAYPGIFLHRIHTGVHRSEGHLMRSTLFHPKDSRSEKTTKKGGEENFVI